jgi:branched-chain amino acid transport system substrate-binding protein
MFRKGDTVHKKYALISIFALALVLALLVVAGCGGGSDEASGDGGGGETAAPFKFGLAGPLTGQYANYGKSSQNGADIAVAELNDGGGVNGGEVSYEIGDDLGDPQQAVLVAQKFIDDSEIVFVNGHVFSGATIAAGAKYEAAGLTMMSPSATNPDISDLGGFVWRVCITDAVQGEGLANYSVFDLDAKKIAIIYDNSDYGRGLAEAYEAAVEAAGAEVVGKEQYGTGDTDFKAQLTKIKSADPDLLFLSGYYPEGSKIALQAKELGIEAQMLGSDGYASQEIIKLGGNAVEGMLISTFFDASKTDPAIQDFVAAHKEEFGTEPDWFAACSYDLTKLIAKAAEAAGKNDRAAINEAIGQLGTYQGITGEITFDENGDVLKPLNIVVVKDGALVTADVQPSETE